MSERRPWPCSPSRSVAVPLLVGAQGRQFHPFPMCLGEGAGMNDPTLTLSLLRNEQGSPEVLFAVNGVFLEADWCEPIRSGLKTDRCTNTAAPAIKHAQGGGAVRATKDALMLILKLLMGRVCLLKGIDH